MEIGDIGLLWMYIATGLSDSRSSFDNLQERTYRTDLPIFTLIESKLGVSFEALGHNLWGAKRDMAQAAEGLGGFPRLTSTLGERQRCRYWAWRGCYVSLDRPPSD